MNLAYVVDAQNRIVAIEGPWDEFARDNAAPGLTRGSVTGRPLLEYVAGSEAREIVRRLFARARQIGALSVPFRCDSPSRRRFLRLDLRGGPGGAVRCETTVEREEERPYQALLDPSASRSVGIVVLCSWCKKARLDHGHWVEIEDAVAPLKLFGEAGLPRLSHGICDPCGESLRRSGPPRSS